jgi:hypothetical protein
VVPKLAHMDANHHVGKSDQALLYLIMKCENEAIEVKSLLRLIEHYA